ncbi:WD40 repeat-like protein [Rickenella mellea]|uniref:WD40 repeat-like protein n=1 Tax=Rickenella mellea TaxID=50990 RepID=A0A4Y7PN05_9AGAM|nr:WD40 repeat-like protein [Rickenella mellea]
MAAEHHPEHTEIEDEDEGDLFIDSGDVLAEVQDDGDHPMDDDDADDAHEGHEHGHDDDMADIDVVYEDTSIHHFPHHTASVFAISTHPTQPIAASGGEDDLGYLWSIEDSAINNDDNTNDDININDNIIAKLTGHTDSVTCTAFSADGELVATGGMDGKVRIWRRVGKDDWKTWEFLTELQGPDEVMKNCQWLRWHPKGSVLLAGSNDTTVWLWQLPSGNTMQVFAGHTGPVQCGDFTPDGKRIVTACSDGTLNLWDPRSPTPIFKLTSSDARFSLPGGITSLAINASSTLAVVGGAEGGVRVVSLSKGEVVGALEGHKEGESVEAVVFVDLAGAGVGGGSGVVVTGGTDGRGCIWDLSTMRLRATLEHEDAVTALLAHPHPKTHLLTSASTDKLLRTWDARTGNLLATHKGHQGPILAAALAKGGDVVVSAGDDSICLVFATTEAS